MQILGLLLYACQASALYFYLEGSERKCVLEDLQKDVMLQGSFRAEEYHADTRTYQVNPQMAIQITVDEVFDNNHRVVNTRAKPDGKFTYTTQDAGVHEVCFQTSATNGWFSASQVKFHLDLASGFSEQFKGGADDKVKDIGRRIEELNGRLQDVRREQVYQRQREAEFRDQSEKTNARVARWTLIQLVLLLGTCAWQLTHLRSFFTKQKLV